MKGTAVPVVMLCFAAFTSALAAQDGEIAGKSLDHWRAELKREWYRANAALEALSRHKPPGEALPLLSEVLPWMRDRRTRPNTLALIKSWGADGHPATDALLRQLKASLRALKEKDSYEILGILRQYQPEATVPKLLSLRAEFLEAPLREGLDKWLQKKRHGLRFLDAIDETLEKLGHDDLPRLLAEMRHRDWRLKTRAVTRIIFNRSGKEREKRVSRALPDLVRGLRLKPRIRAPKLPRKDSPSSAHKAYRVKLVANGSVLRWADLYRSSCADALAWSGPHYEMPSFALTLLRYREPRPKHGTTDWTRPACWRAGLSVVRRSEIGREAAVKPILQLLRLKSFGNYRSKTAIRVLGEMGADAKSALPYLKKLAASESRHAAEAGRAIIAIEDDR